MPEAEKNAFEEVIEWFKDAADWVQENLGDPAIAETIREDLGLAAGASIPENKKNEFAQFAAGLDPDKTAFEETVAELKDVIEAFIDLGNALKEDQATGWDVAYLIGRFLTTETVRVGSPFVYALAKLLLFVSEDPETVEQFDPAMIVGLLKGQPPPQGSGERILQRVTALAWLLVTVGEAVVKKFLDLDPRDAYGAYYGWDPDPASNTPLADQVSGRAITLMLGPPGEVSAQLSITLLGVPSEHRGPALFLSFGGGLTAEHTVENTTYRFRTGAAGAFDLFIPFGGSPLAFTAGGDPSGWVKLDVAQATRSAPAFTIGDADGTRIDVDKFLFGVELTGEGAGFRLGIEKAALVIDLSEGDGFLDQLPGGEIRVEFGLVFTADTAHGLRVEGGTQARATLPINASLFGVFTIHHLEIALGPSTQGRDLALELAGAFSLHLGPFTATVDRIGMLLDVGFEEGNLGFLDAALGFKPPNGIGLLIDVGIVKGGGYLFVDAQRGEYAGALELKIGPVSVKAIAILSTKMPDGSPGWALLLLIYGQFAPIQLSWGFTLTGIGGMIGLQHAVSIDALRTGMSSGVLDDILFPADPVGDAPRIINRLRTVFPVTPRAVTFGPMLELGWGTPSIVIIRLGVIVQLDNAIGPGAGSVEFGRLVIIGQLLVQMLPKATGTPPILKLLVDILGHYDAESARLGFIARLRDSQVAGISLTGMLVVQADFGEDPSFVVAAGGFHPRFQDIPPGTPAPIDRIGFKLEIAVVKITIEGYFALAASTVQAGASIRAEAKLGAVSIEGWLSFDAIFYFEPYFHFEADIRGDVAVRFKGRSLAGVELKMTLSGPGLWRAVGSVSFSILFWDIEKSFDESIGAAPETPAIATDVAALMRRELSNTGNWSAQLPAGGEAFVTIGPIQGVTGVLAHPLGRLVVTQRVAPLGLTLQRFGNSQVQGPNRFDIEKVDIGGRDVASPTTLTEAFTRAHFVDMTEEEKLSAPSFERFTAGVSVGTAAYRLPSDQGAADLEYETHYLEPPTLLLRGTLILATLTDARIAAADLRLQARLGAAGRSSLRRDAELRPADPPRVTVTGAPLAAASTSDMGKKADFSGAAAYATAAAAESMRASGEGGIQLVEAFEVG